MLSNIDKAVDILVIEWYEAHKRILHKQTNSGVAIALKFLNENPDLTDGDILWENDRSLLIVEIKPCESIVITPKSILEASSLCYEIGNRHLPLFYGGDCLLIPYDVPLHNLLESSGYEINIEDRKLTNAFNTTVLPHLQVGGTVRDNLSNKNIQLSTSL